MNELITNRLSISIGNNINSSAICMGNEGE